MLRNTSEIANIIETIYSMEFRGKEKGRYALTRQQLKLIAGRERLEEIIISSLEFELKLRGFCLIDVDGGCTFAILKSNILGRFRRPTKAVLNQALKGNI